MEQLITFVCFLLCISLASAQLTFHLDANTNTYTLKTPNAQQTFTQHFNGGRNAAARQGSFNQINAAAYQPQQQQLQTTGAHQFVDVQNNNRQDISNDLYRQQLELQQQLQQQQQQQQLQQQPRQAEQQNNLYTTYQNPQQFAQRTDQQQYQQREGGQEKVYAIQDISPLYQQIQQAQQTQLTQQQQQRQQFAAQPQFATQPQLAAQPQFPPQSQFVAQPQFAAQSQFAAQPQFAAQTQFAAYQQPSATAENGQDGSAYVQFEPQSQKYQSQQQSVANRLLGSSFSPSNEVSHVKFSNGVASYDF